MKRRFKVRFHLGAGENFMKWRIENTETGAVTFFSHEDCELELRDCKLYNQRGTAEKIFNGDNKTVCAWVMARKVLVVFDNKCHLPDENAISYNPKKQPYWIDAEGNNMDKKEFEWMETSGRQLYRIGEALS